MSAKGTLVQRLMKYKDMVRLSELHETHRHHRPLHLDKEFKEFNQSKRQMNKFLAKLISTSTNKQSVVIFWSEIY